MGSVGSHAVQWTSWTRDGTNYGNCRVPTATDESSCASETSGAGQWWTGVTWHSGLLSTEPQCTIFGICNFDLSVTGLSTEQDCTSTFTCEGCNSCNTEQLCVDSGTCNDDAGCVLSYAPTASSQYACESAELWTPLGCLRVEFDQTQCAASGGQWVTPVTTREACLSKAVLCKEPEPIGLFNQIPRPLNQLPWGWSFKPAEQCAACGGNMTSYYDWSGVRIIHTGGGRRVHVTDHASLPGSLGAESLDRIRMEATCAATLQRVDQHREHHRHQERVAAQFGAQNRKHCAE